MNERKQHDEKLLQIRALLLALGLASLLVTAATPVALAAPTGAQQAPKTICIGDTITPGWVITSRTLVSATQCPNTIEISLPPGISVPASLNAEVEAPPPAPGQSLLVCADSPLPANSIIDQIDVPGAFLNCKEKGVHITAVNGAATTACQGSPIPAGYRITAKTYSPLCDLLHLDNNAVTIAANGPTNGGGSSDF
jgi:hypothetical protein